MFQNVLKKMVEEAKEKGIKVTLNDVIKNAALNDVELDDAIRDVRKAINTEQISPVSFEDNVLLLTHKNVMKPVIDAELQDKFVEYVAKVLEDVDNAYQKEVGKPLTDDQRLRLKTEIENDPEVKAKVEQLVAESGEKKLITPFDNAQTPFKMTP